MAALCNPRRCAGVRRPTVNLTSDQDTGEPAIWIALQIRTQELTTIRCP